MTDRMVFVPGVPAPQGSKRHVGRGILVESSTRLKPWRATVTAAIADQQWQPILHGPVGLWLTFYFPRTKGHYGTGRNADRLKPSAPTYHTVIPDADKLARAVLDAVAEAGVIRNDSQVASLSVVKRYGQPGVAITMRPWDAP